MRLSKSLKRKSAKRLPYTKGHSKMKIQYKSIVNVDGVPTIFKEISGEVCCENARQACEKETLRFPGGEHLEIPQIAIASVESGYYGDSTTDFYPISFCPFCGVKIICEEIERVKVVETRTKVEETIVSWKENRKE